MGRSDGLGGKRVVVLGGTSGLGFAAAQAALGAGATVVVASSNKARVAHAVAAHTANAATIGRSCPAEIMSILPLVATKAMLCVLS